MRFDIIISGVGGQGVLTVANVLALAAVKQGYFVKQSESHGMAQRGGAVVAHLRMSNQPIFSSLIAEASASLILSLEPLEALRNLRYLAVKGTMLTASSPVRNIAGYPKIPELLEQISRIPGANIIDSAALAREAGSLKTENIVMIGGASVLLPLEEEVIKDSIGEKLLRKGEKVVTTALKAFDVGRRSMHRVADTESRPERVSAEPHSSQLPVSDPVESSFSKIRSCLNKARKEGQRFVQGAEGYQVLSELGFHVPNFIELTAAAEAESITLAALPGDQVVVKIISDEAVHKSAVGGVRIVAKNSTSVLEAVEAMSGRIGTPCGYIVEELIEYDPSFGSEILLGARWTREFGPILVLGPGGSRSEFLVDRLKPGQELAILSASLFSPSAAEHTLERLAVTAPELEDRSHLRRAELVHGLKALARPALELMPGEMTELEINPWVRAAEKMVALDVLIRCGDQGQHLSDDTSTENLRYLLRPETMAIVGVSRGEGVGRTVLTNCIGAGFSREKILLIHPDATSLEGCRCYPRIEDLPHVVDLLVVAVKAENAAALVRQAIERDAARTIILIPGGFEEKTGSEDLAQGMKTSLEKARRERGSKVLINGGNCLGIRSLPGNYNTLFIPPNRLPRGGPQETPLALLSQSGALAVALMSKLNRFNPRYVISIGNQFDLTLGQYIEHLKQDQQISVFALYVEGFRPLDGLRFLRAAQEICQSGRQVIVYSAGRTPTGRQATTSHTAAVSSDFRMVRELCRQVGAVSADNLSDFVDLIKLSVLLQDRNFSGWRLGVVSNAGFECVAAADSVARFRLARFQGGTKDRLGNLFQEAGIASIVGVGNPLDVTPMCRDRDFGEVVRSVLMDENVDAVVVGCVPLTPSLATLPAPEGFDQSSVVSELTALSQVSAKPWITVVDSGTQYDPMAEALEQGGVPVFRSMDRAVRLLEEITTARLHQR